jgi:uncharacterized membrane protein YbhN (UPF0104 family)
MTPLFRRLIVALLGAVLLYGGFVAYTGAQTLGASLESFHWRMFLAALGLASLNYLLRFAKWEYYLARLGIRGIPKYDSFLVFLSGFVFTVTPGKVGEVFKSAVLADTHGVSVERTAPIVLAERLTDVVGVVLLILVGSTGFSDGLPWALAGGACVVCALALILWEKPVEWALDWLSGRPGRLGRITPRLRGAWASLKIVTSPTALVWPTTLSLIGWGGEGFALYLILLGFDLNAPATLAIFFYATATLAGALIPVPGGLGVTEAMIQEQLVRVWGAPLGPAAASMFLIRFATLWWAVLVGFVALGLLKSRHPQLLKGGQARA